MWVNVFMDSFIFYNSYSKLKYGWLSIKNARRNVFVTFFYTGMLYKQKFKAAAHLKNRFIVNKFTFYKKHINKYETL